GMMIEGPESELTLTENAQPALMAVSLAAVRVLEREMGYALKDCVAFVAGHSLGEFSALAAAGAFSVADAARILKRRGLAMQRAVPAGEGAMAALVGAQLEQAPAIAAHAAQSGGVSPANRHAPGQVGVRGHKSAVERAIAAAAERGIRRSVLLPVSAPFHCPLMQPAAEELAEILDGITLLPPAVPVIANVTAAPVKDPEAIRRLLVEQVTALVRWREGVLAMKAAGVEQVVELGAGKVLSGLVKRIDRDLLVQSAGTPEELEAVARTL